MRKVSFLMKSNEMPFLMCLLAKAFSSEFCEFFKNTIFYKLQLICVTHFEIILLLSKLISDVE